MNATCPKCTWRKNTKPKRVAEVVARHTARCKGEAPMTNAERVATCATCGERLIRDWSGWMHARKPVRRHVVKPLIDGDAR